MQYIDVSGGSENNLKHINVTIPHNWLTVITGLSGSGKSSLVNDILLREGQRMYLETFSAYTRSRLGKIRPAKVTNISGLLPVISVGQTHVQANKRSTAGTFSEVSPLLRQLFSRYNDQEQKLNRNHFSFNSNNGWCPQCKGLGIEEYIDVDKLVGNPAKSLREGALVITLPNGYTIYSQVTIDELNKVCEANGFTVDTPWNKLTPEQKRIILYGSTTVKVLYGKHSLESRMKWTGMTARPRDEAYYRGIIPVMEEILKRDRNDNILRFVSARSCSVCKGERLNQQALGVTWKGRGYSYYDQLPFSELKKELLSKSITNKGEEALINSIVKQLKQLCTLSVGHISCSRLSETLSQGELRRMRLSQLNQSGLTGVLYLFDEPSIGLHPRDTASLIDTMYKLIERGNTVVVVEHSEQVIKSAQHLIELGPGAGFNGGEVVFSGTPEDLAEQKPINSPTAKLLSNGFRLNPTDNEPLKVERFFKIHINKKHNILNQTFTFAQQALNVITGVSGAGKSTLVNHGLSVCNEFKQIIYVDQKPIGRTSRSNPATYTGLFEELRKLFAQLPQAKTKRYTASHFSFNSKQGQCDTCAGTGAAITGMHIFEDLVQPCPACNGTRYKTEILDVELNRQSISQILQMSVDEAMLFFADNKTIQPYLNAMQMLGLGYLHLGQPSSTLSGGEAQRIKLATYLRKHPASECLYILDEPTTGLHAADIAMLISALRSFTAKGHTVVVVEHDAQLILNADWIVDLGPEGGANGGKCLFNGMLADFIKNHSSPTTLALKNPQAEIKGRAAINKPSAICLNGISTNNLKNIDISIEAGQMVAFTGLSGSGKTSLLMHTLHAEGQRLFTENLSTFRRLQIKLSSTGLVGKVKSMMPTVAVEADTPTPDIRSTVASMGGVYDLFRLLFARFAHNPNSKAVTAADFSLANEYSICQLCEGTGFTKQTDKDLIFKDKNLPLLKGALSAHKTVNYFTEDKNKYRWILLTMCRQQNINLEKPWKELASSEKNAVLHGTGDTIYDVDWQFKRKNNIGVHRFSDTWKGLCPLIEEEYKTHFPSARGKAALELLTDIPCKICNGYRLKPQLLRFTFNGKHIGETMEFTINEALNEVNSSAFDEISPALRKQLIEKLQFLQDAGLGYLPLNRPAAWLSTGELKWIRLSSLLASNLSGMCIILDEPSSGMDTESRCHFVNTLIAAKQKENTILVSDHHPELIKCADRVIELGPGAGKDGGHIIADIEPGQATQSLSPITSQILKKQNLKPTANPVKPKTKALKFVKSTSIYPGYINLISGKTGSGKTRLLNMIFNECSTQSEIATIKSDSKLPVSSSNSNLATRTRVINDIKKAFAKTDMAKAKGLKEADFGFNSKRGQCNRCKGAGTIRTSLDFLPDVVERCPECNGKRYAPYMLGFKYKGRDLSQWLSLTVNEMLWEDFLTIGNRNILQWLKSLGLGYVTIGQDIATLSHGELRRLSLAENLSGLKGKNAIILFDSPSHGLDPKSAEALYSMLHQLTQKGHTVVVAEAEEVGRKSVVGGQ
ncbi:MAG: ATP-binding cassette domain-containing protein [Bacteroidales bacterium]